MEQLSPWLTPALILGLFGWVRYEIRSQGEAIAKRIDDLRAENSKRIDDLRADNNRRLDDVKTDVLGLRAEMNQRFDQVHRELGENRERMAKLEGSLDGFLAGRRDRDAA